jgi:hypothetical protein
MDFIRSSICPLAACIVVRHAISRDSAKVMHLQRFKFRREDIKMSKDQNDQNSLCQRYGQTAGVFQNFHWPDI